MTPPPPVWGTPPRTFFGATQRVARDTKLGAAPANDAITAEILQAVRGNGRGVVLGVELPTAGPARLVAGQSVYVGWRRGRPVVILAGKVRRAQFPDVPAEETGGGVVEELFLAPDPARGGAVDVWFRNDQQVTALGIVIDGETMEAVRWSEDGTAFYVRCSGHRYHLYEFDGKVSDAPVGASPPAVTKLTVETPLTKEIVLIDLTIDGSTTSTLHSLEILAADADDSIISSLDHVYVDTAVFHQHRIFRLSADTLFPAGNAGCRCIIHDVSLDTDRHLLVGLTVILSAPSADGALGDTALATSTSAVSIPAGGGGTLQGMVERTALGAGGIVKYQTSVDTSPQSGKPWQETHGCLLDITAGTVLWSTLGASLVKTIVQAHENVGCRVFFYRPGSSDGPPAANFLVRVGPNPGTFTHEIASVFMPTARSDDTGLQQNLWDAATSPFVEPSYDTVETLNPSGPQADKYIAVAAKDFLHEHDVLAYVQVTGGDVHTAVISAAEWHVNGVAVVRPPIVAPPARRKLWITVIKRDPAFPAIFFHVTAPFVIQDTGAVLRQLADYQSMEQNSGVGESASGGMMLLASASHHHALYRSIVAPTAVGLFRNLVHLVNLDTGAARVVQDLSETNGVDPGTGEANPFTQWLESSWNGPTGVRLLPRDFAYATAEEMLVFLEAWDAAGVPTLDLSVSPPIIAALVSPGFEALLVLPEGVVPVTPVTDFYAVNFQELRVVEARVRDYRVLPNATLIPRLPDP